MKFLFNKRFITVVVLSLVLPAGCKDYSDLNIAPTESGNADFSTYVAVGNSLTAGYQSNALFESAQQFSFPNLLAHQIGIEGFEQPLISDPGIGDPGRIELTDLQSQSTQFNTSQGAPINTGIGRPYNNLGVPGAKIADYINQSQTLNNNPFYPLIVNEGNPSNPLQSIHAAVEKLQPTLVSFWLGNNDILDFATSGGLKPFTNPNDFQTQFISSINQIKNLDSAPTIIITNIPAVSTIPFTTVTGPQFQAQIAPNDQVPGIVVQKTFYKANTDIGASENREPASLVVKANLSKPDSALVLLTARDFLSYLGVSADPQASSYNEQVVNAILDYWRGFIVQAGIATEEEAANYDQENIENTMTQITIGQYQQTFGTAAATQFAVVYPGFDFDQPFGLSGQNPFPNQFVLDRNEISITNTVTKIYNNIIASQGDIHFDVNAFFKDIIADGQYTDSKSGATFKPEIGSLFSLDGIHPSNKAQAILTNKMIEAINSATGSSIQKVDLSSIPEGIPVAN